jgi:hypothetical protein
MGLAALTGRVYRTATLARAAAVDTLRTPSGEPLAAPAGEREAAAAVTAFAAMGGPRDSIAALHARLERYVESVRPDRRAAAHAALLDRVAVLSFPEMATTESHRAAGRGSYLLDVQAALVRGDSAGARTILDQVGSLRGTLPAGFVSLVGTYQEARALLLLRDTTIVTQRLDAVLMHLADVRSDVLPDPTQTASLVRAMALRAELAAAARDTTTARWWAGNTLTLWSDADPPLAAVVSRMRAIAGARN